MWVVFILINQLKKMLGAWLSIISVGECVNYHKQFSMDLYMEGDKVDFFLFK